MHKRLALAVALLIALIIPFVVLAQSLAYTVYVPMTHWGGLPRADAQCAAADPGAINDLRLWVTPTTPQPGEFFSVCALAPE